MKILKQGAEAVIYSDFLDGQKVLVKERIKKRYRLDEIDRKLRTNRMRQEMKLMRESRGHGVLTPKIISSDEKSCKFVMEDLGGVIAKDSLDKAKNLKKICSAIGANIGRLHSSEIVHGDLTTSNMIVKDGEIYFLDFGLGQFSNRIEDMATDLNVLHETLRATHNKIFDRCWNEIMRGYKSENIKHAEVFDRMNEIKFRIRYKDKTASPEYSLRSRKIKD